MISPSPGMRVFVATQPADFRKGIDGLAAVCRRQLQRDPMDGAAFVFRNRGGTGVKILFYDGQGFWLCQKRLSQGRFGRWPVGAAVCSLQPHQLQVLLAGGDAEAATGAPVWRPLAEAD